MQNSQRIFDGNPTDFDISPSTKMERDAISTRSDKNTLGNKHVKSPSGVDELNSESFRSSASCASTIPIGQSRSIVLDIYNSYYEYSPASEPITPQQLSDIPENFDDESESVTGLLKGVESTEARQLFPDLQDEQPTHEEAESEFLIPKLDLALDQLKLKEGYDSLVHWLNCVLRPPNASLASPAEVREQLSVQLCEKKTMKQRESIRSAIRRGRLRFRGDIPFDVGLQQKAISLLLSLNRTWLIAGISCVLNDTAILHLETKNDSADIEFRKYLSQCFFTDADLLSRYNLHGRWAPSGNSGKKYKEELHAVLLERLLMLILLVDIGSSRGISSAPLFVRGTRRQAHCKSTNELMLCLQKDVVAGELDFLKHLQRLGIELTYRQNPIDEYFVLQVENLAFDMNDGVRLARLVEITKRVSYGKYLKQMVPWPETQAQRIKNVQCCLSLLETENADFDGISALHIAMGARDPLLKLLHNIAHACSGQTQTSY